MIITFFGSDQYSALVLKHLLTTPNLTISAVVTTRSKPVDIHGNPLPHPLKYLADKHNLKLLYYPDNNELLHNLSDQAVLASFGYILPQSVIDLFPAGILCLHPSLLPQYRGATPVPTAIAMGETTSGVTLFNLTNKIDQGDILTQATAPIEPDDTSPILLTRLFQLGAKLLTGYLKFGNPPKPTFPAPDQLLFTTRFTRQSGFLQWNTLQQIISGRLPDPPTISNQLLHDRISYNTPTEPLTALHDLIRALTPWPGVWTIAPTKKGDLRLVISSALPTLTIKLPGKPKPISWDDFSRYYLPN